LIPNLNKSHTFWVRNMYFKPTGTWAPLSSSRRCVPGSRRIHSFGRKHQYLCSRFLNKITRWSSHFSKSLGKPDNYSIKCKKILKKFHFPITLLIKIKYYHQWFIMILWDKYVLILIASMTFEGNDYFLVFFLCISPSNYNFT
jgi:hypothetical protein